MRQKLTWSTGSSVAVFSSSCTSSAPCTSSLLFRAAFLNTLGWTFTNIIPECAMSMFGIYINVEMFCFFKLDIKFNLTGILTGSVAVWLSGLRSVLVDLYWPGKVLLCWFALAQLLWGLWNSSCISRWLHPAAIWLKFTAYVRICY